MNFYLSSALKCSAALLAFALLAGCGPATGEASYREGQTAFAHQDYMRAMRKFSESVTRSPQEVDNWVMLARTQLALGDIPAARDALQRATFSACGHSNSVTCGQIDITELAGQLAYYAKNYAEAQANYSALIAATQPPAVRSRGYAGLAVIDILGIVGSAANENRARAHVHLMDAVRLHSNNAAARYHLGRLYRDAFDYREAALDQFELYTRLETQAVERVMRVQRHIIPDLRESIARVAASLPGADRRDSAASASALKKADDAWRKGSYKTARQRYLEAYQADVLSFPAALGLAKSCTKVDPSKVGQREALKYFRLASQIRPSSREALMGAAEFAMKTGNYVTAVEAYSRAVSVRSTDITAIDGLITALQKTGQGKSAAIYQTYRNNLPKRTR